MFCITFLCEDGTKTAIYANAGESLLDISREANLAIDAPCSGNGACGKCRVQIREGQLDSLRSPHLSEEEYVTGWRLACCSRICSDVTVFVPDAAFAYKSRMKISGLESQEELQRFEALKQEIAQTGISLENGMSLLEVCMDEPSQEDTLPDNERLIRALCRQADVQTVRLTYQVLKKLPDVLRKSGFQIKCAAERTADELLVYDLYPIQDEVVLAGLAVDIGTTTVSAVLLDLETGEILARGSSGNGQIRYGADVINRIIEQQKPGGVKRLQDAVIRETIDPLIEELCQSAKLPKKQIYRMCVAGNTTMNHLFAGIHADSIRMEPYIPAFFQTDPILAKDLGLQICPDARVIIAPNIGSYVGGDITAGTLVSRIWNRSEFSLFIDLGTNGELVFGNSEFLMSCACSAGPAFEGGDISCGMRATDGAIEACTIEKETMEPVCRVIGEPGTRPVGLCGSGLIDVVSELFRNGIINARGKFIREGRRIRHDEYGTGSYVIAFREESGSVKDLELTEIDIDNFIRAKGAVFSAIRTILKSLDFPLAQIDEVYVAGGIGSGINLQNAVRIGMFPKLSPDKFHYIGNTSLLGACLMLLSGECEKKTAELASNMTYLELSTIPDYMDEFVGACFLPHTDERLFSETTEESDLR